MKERASTTITTIEGDKRYAICRWESTSWCQWHHWCNEANRQQMFPSRFTVLKSNVSQIIPTSTLLSGLIYPLASHPTHSVWGRICFNRGWLFLISALILKEQNTWSVSMIWWCFEVGVSGTLPACTGAMHSCWWCSTLSCYLTAEHR